MANWPTVIPAAKVCSDLVDSTDFLPTLCAAAAQPLPADMKIDGRSFLPQLRGEPGTSREWIYSWYAPNQGRIDVPKEFAFTQHYKLYRDGAFFDTSRDPKEEKPLEHRALDGEAARVRRKLQAILDRYQGARPAKYPQPK